MKQNIIQTNVVRRECSVLAMLMAIPLLATGTGAPAQDSSVTQAAGSRRVSPTLSVERVQPSASPKQLQQPEQSVTVQVRYPLRYGYVGTSSAFGEVGPYSCDAFSVHAGVATSASEDRQPQLIRIAKEGRMRGDGGMYTCDYQVSGLPFDQTITLRVGIGSPREPSTEAWVGGSEAQPPQGQFRAIVDGIRNLQLNASQPRSELVFEMTYAAPLAVLPTYYEQPQLTPSAPALGVPRLLQRRPVRSAGQTGP